ncbi:MAG: hypothetical protein JEZ07_17310 [Phycisphaerae bacterium]|nr:hypothetical protein [Phycisphaerae bacterium]
MNQERIARRGQFQGVIVSHCPFGQGYNSLIIRFEGIASVTIAKAQPGQFVQVACGPAGITKGTTLRRPFSISGVTLDGDTTCLEIIYRIIGPGTEALANMSVGDMIDVLAPLGQGFKLPKDPDAKCLLLGGGIGLPPMFFLADRLAQQGVDRVGFAAARNIEVVQNDIVAEAIVDNPLVPSKAMKHFNASDTGSIIASDDGSCGFKGNILEALEGFLARHPDWNIATMYACGPEPMLKALALFAQAVDMECQVCMEAYMACGIGVCQSCAIELAGGERSYKLVCAHGPVFNGREIKW